MLKLLGRECCHWRDGGGTFKVMEVCMCCCRQGHFSREMVEEVLNLWRCACVVARQGMLSLERWWRSCCWQALTSSRWA